MPLISFHTVMKKTQKVLTDKKTAAFLPIPSSPPSTVTDVTVRCTGNWNKFCQEPLVSQTDEFVPELKTPCDKLHKEENAK